MDTKPDASPRPRTTSSVRLNRLSVLCVVLLLMSFLTGANALTDVSTNYVDLATILSVLAFIGSMVVLAISMIGNTFRS
ncbi:MAG TPA: hypothetical protein VF595_12750 [Tepidisphaeraceae bacterium]